jgi:microcystin-dependent protein
MHILTCDDYQEDTTGRQPTDQEDETAKFCDGSAYNKNTGVAILATDKDAIKTPDLRDRFILSNSTTKTIGTTGGESTVTLQTTHLPPHTHSGTTSTGGSHNHTITDPGHKHSIFTISGAQSYEDVPYWPDNVYVMENTYDWRETESKTTGISLDDHSGHTHGFTTDNGPGQSTAHNNMPPYYVLAFIMRIY